MNSIFVQQSACYPEDLAQGRRLILLATCLGLGAAGTFLFRGHALGLNLLLGTALLCLAGRSLLPAGRHGFGQTWFPLTLLFFAACVAWRASQILNALACGMLLLLLLLASGDFGAWRMSIAGTARRIGHALVQIATGFVQLVAWEVDWDRLPQRPMAGKVWSAFLGLLVATPLVILFGALFSSADAVYQKHVHALFDFDGLELFLSILWTALIWWLSAGYFRNLSLPGTSSELATTRSEFFKLGAIELNVTLLVLNLLFLSFVLVQIKYLFGGAEIIQVTPGLGYADYARRGFFELVTVAALVLPLLLVADWIHPATSTKRPLRVLSALLIALLTVVMISAAKRMHLYQAEYGLTELRFYVSSFMLLLAFVFLWFLLTVLRGRGEFFLSGTIVLGALSIITLHVANPDAWIARINLQRGAEGKTFDLEYASQLSADAAPALRAGLTRVPEEHRTALLEHLNTTTETTWQEWNWSRWQAARLSNKLARERSRDESPGAGMALH